MGRRASSVVVFAIVIATAAVRAGTGQPATAQDPQLTALLDLAGKRLVQQLAASSVLIGEETYRQEMYRRVWETSSSSIGGGSTQVERRDIVARREMKGDLALISVPEAAATGLPWIEVRDVSSVDGKRVRTSDNQVLEALGTPRPELKLREIADQAAAQNLNSEASGVNVPRLALVAVHPANRARFAFKLGKQEAVNGAQAVAVSFTEQQTPSLVAGGARPLEGTVWIDRQGGNVVKSFLKVAQFSSLVTVKVDYAWNAALEQWLPARMEETSGNAQVVTGLKGEAKYTNFRRVAAAQPGAGR